MQWRANYWNQNPKWLKRNQSLNTATTVDNNCGFTKTLFRNEHPKNLVGFNPLPLLGPTPPNKKILPVDEANPIRALTLGDVPLRG